MARAQLQHALFIQHQRKHKLQHSNATAYETNASIPAPISYSSNHSNHSSAPKATTHRSIRHTRGHALHREVLLINRGTITLSHAPPTSKGQPPEPANEACTPSAHARAHMHTANATSSPSACGICHHGNALRSSEFITTPLASFLAYLTQYGNVIYTTIAF